MISIRSGCVLTLLASPSFVPCFQIIVMTNLGFLHLVQMDSYLPGANLSPSYIQLASNHQYWFAVSIQIADQISFQSYTSVYWACYRLYSFALQLSQTSRASLRHRSSCSRQIQLLLDIVGAVARVGRCSLCWKWLQDLLFCIAGDQLINWGMGRNLYHSIRYTVARLLVRRLWIAISVEATLYCRRHC